MKSTARFITKEELDANQMWRSVMESLNTVLTLDKVNQKPLQRTGKVMQRSLNELFFFIAEYDRLRKEVINDSKRIS